MTAAMSERNAPLPADPAAGLARPPVRRPARAHPRVILALIGAGAAATIWLWWDGTPASTGQATGSPTPAGSPDCWPATASSSSSRSWPASRRWSAASAPTGWPAGTRWAAGTPSASSSPTPCSSPGATRSPPTSRVPGEALDAPRQLPGRAHGHRRRACCSSASASSRRGRSGAGFEYETWYYLHLYTYLAVALAFSHQFANGAEFMSNAAARWAWSALYIGGARLRSSGTGSSLRPPGRPAPAARARRPEGGAERGERPHRWPGPERAAGRAGPVLPVAVPRPGPVVDVVAVLAVGPAGPGRLRITVKDRGRPQRRLAEAASRALAWSPRVRTGR